jgi:hypothetical protein
MEEQIHKHVNDRPDSIEIGTPSKGGTVKIHFDAKADIKETEALIERGFQARQIAKNLLAKQESG